MGSTPEHRTRRACEPCRRKKVRCPAERPICSFCRRLTQQCVYLPREQARPRQSENKRLGKIVPAEENGGDSVSPVGQDEDLRFDGEHSPQDVENQPRNTRPNAYRRIVSYDYNSEKQPGVVNPELPVEVLEYFIDEYGDKVAQKPLPLFTAPTLRAILQAGPTYLRWSFLSLMLQCSSHPYFDGKESEAARWYASSAHDTLMPLTMKDMASLEMIQSLCLLALHDLKALRPSRAWHMVGTASRLAVSCNWTRHDREADLDHSSRCFWSVFLMERIFSPQYTLLDQCLRPPKYPKSTDPPPVSMADHPRNQIGAESPVEEGLESTEKGICLSLMQAVSIWGEVVCYLHRLRCKILEDAWLPGTKYSEITQKIYEFERRTSTKHLYGNVAPHSRSASELSRDADYWRPWFLMQITHHATSSVLNHPFVHIWALRGTDKHPPPRLFLQSITDSALYHSRWVVRLLQLCRDLEFDVADPLLGNLVAATATIPWMFQFAQDGQAAAIARDCYLCCEQFLTSAAFRWPHLEQQVVILRRLQQPYTNLREQDQQGDLEDSSTVTFAPSLIWALLDFSALQSVPASQGDHRNPRPSPMPEATLRVSTHIVHPVDEAPTLSASAGGLSSTPMGSDLEQIFLDDLFAGFGSSIEMRWPPPDAL